MTQIGGGAFSLMSVDIGGSFVNTPDRWADHVDVIAGGTVTATLDGHGPTYVHLTPNFLNVTSVLFDPFVNDNLGENNNEFTLDNIELPRFRARHFGPSRSRPRRTRFLRAASGNYSAPGQPPLRRGLAFVVSCLVDQLTQQPHHCSQLAPGVNLAFV